MTVRIARQRKSGCVGLNLLYSPFVMLQQSARRIVIDNVIELKTFDQRRQVGLARHIAKES